MHYLVPLILTIIIEAGVVYLLGFRNKNLILGTVIINILTNPTLNYLVSYTVDILLKYGIPYILLLEAVIVIIEYLMLRQAFKNMREPFFKLSLVMNGTSFLIGVLLLWH